MPWMDAAPYALWQFLVCLMLALVEIEIEGPHGWAKNLPTWRWGPQWFLTLTNGKPVTGYHVTLNGLILVFLHGPLVGNFSWAGEWRTLSIYFQFAFVWDFLWFLLNPAFGWPKFAPGKVWWFQTWIGPFPADYYSGAAASLFFAWLAAELPSRGAELCLQLPLIAAAALWPALRRSR